MQPRCRQRPIPIGFKRLRPIVKAMHGDVIIIGGGIAGLACAIGLCQHGLRPLVLESSGRLGGRAQSWRDEVTGDTVDIGPHILLTECRNMLALLEQLGTVDQIVWQNDKFITLVGQPHPVPIRMHRLPPPLHFLPSLLAAPQVSLRDLASNRRLLWQVMRMSADEAIRLDEISAGDHLRRLGVSEQFIEWFWRSAAMAIMNVPLERCSAGALLSFFRYMIGRSGYQVGFPGVGLAELFAPQAASRIEAAGGRVLMHSEVAGLCGTDGRLTGVRLADGSRIEASFCVATVPPQCLQPLLPPAWVQTHAVLRTLADFKPSPYISSYIWFDRKLTRERFWTRVWSPRNLNYDSYELSNIRPEWAGRASVIASNIVHSQRASQRAEQLSDAQIIEATVTEIAAFVPEAGQARIRHARVHRIPMAIPAPYPGSEQLRPPVETPIEGLLLAGDWVRTGLPASMEGAVRAGRLAAEQVLLAKGRPRQLALAPPAMQGLVRLIGGR